MVRLKHRYLLVNILYPEAVSTTAAALAESAEGLPYHVKFNQPSPDALTPQLLLRVIRDGVAELFGDYGSGMVGGSLQIKYTSPPTSTAIVRVSRSHYRLVWAALAFVTSLSFGRNNSVPCVMQVVRVSGTIRKAEEEAIRRARASIRRAANASGKTIALIADHAAIQAGPGADHEEAVDMIHGIEDPHEAGDVDEEDDDAD